MCADVTEANTLLQMVIILECAPGRRRSIALEVLKFAVNGSGSGWPFGTSFSPTELAGPPKSNRLLTAAYRTSAYWEPAPP